MAVRWIHKQVHHGTGAGPHRRGNSFGSTSESPLRYPAPGRKRGAIVIGAIVLALAVGAVWISFGKKTGVAGSNSTSLATVERRDFVHSLRLHGIVEATQSLFRISAEPVRSNDGHINRHEAGGLGNNGQAGRSAG